MSRAGLSSHEKTHAYFYTADPDKISRIKANMEEGRQREMLSRPERERLDIMAQAPTKNHILELRQRAGLPAGGPPPVVAGQRQRGNAA